MKIKKCSQYYIGEVVYSKITRYGVTKGEALTVVDNMKGPNEEITVENARGDKILFPTKYLTRKKNLE